MKLTPFKLSALPLTVLALNACTTNEEVAIPQPESNRIGFSVVTNNLTRASNSYCSTNLPGKIKVTAYNNGANYYGGFDEITKSEADGTVTWTGTTDRYWPRVDDDTWPGLTFFAYVKDDALSENAEATENKIVLPAVGAEVLSPKVENFTVKGNVADQIDLMYATTTNRKNTGAVPLNFRHALSQVCFKAQNLDPRIKSLVINKIEIYGLTSRGNYQFPTASTYVTPTPTHDATGVPTGAGEKGKWSLSKASDYTNKTFSIGGVDGDEGQPLNKSVTCPSKPEGSSEYNQPDPVNISVPEMTGMNNDQHEAATETLNPYKNALNLIPQEVDARITEGDGGAYFKIYASMAVSTTSDLSDNPTSESKEIILPVDINWEEGNRYIYTFIWEDNGKVSYEPSVADFANVEKSTNVPETSYHDAVLMREGGWNESTWEYEPALYFATCNIGADTPDEYGWYFKWGDPQGIQVIDGTVVNDYDKDQLPSYNKSVEELLEAGYIYKKFSDPYEESEDFEYVLSDKYDAAKQRWGDLWRMPTQKELEWLASTGNCERKSWSGKTEDEPVTFEFNSKNIICEKYNAAGTFFMSKTTGGIIFLPNAGRINRTWSGSKLEYAGSAFWYISSTPDGEYNVICMRNGDFEVSGHSRYTPQSIRPVRDLNDQ